MIGFPKRSFPSYLATRALSVTGGSPDFVKYEASKGVNVTVDATSDFHLDLTAAAGTSGTLTVTNNSFQMGIAPANIGSRVFHDVLSTRLDMAANTTSVVAWFTPDGTNYYLYISNIA